MFSILLVLFPHACTPPFHCQTVFNAAYKNIHKIHNTMANVLIAASASAFIFVVLAHLGLGALALYLSNKLGDLLLGNNLFLIHARPFQRWQFTDQE